jgi:AcrR family transcriptional regulator
VPRPSTNGDSADTTAPADPAGGRQRRSSAELRALILEAARDTFAEKGYAGTTKRDVAEAAGVSLSVLYRHFESIADLFAGAALIPFTKFLDELTTEWMRQRDGEWDDEAMMRSYLGDLLNNLRMNRDVLTGLVAASKDVDSDVLATLTTAVDEMFARIGLMSELEAHRRQWFSPVGIDSVLRMLVALVLGLVTYDWLLLKPGNDHNDQLLDTMVPLALWGLARHPPGTTGTA